MNNNSEARPMDSEEARSLVLEPYITEKTFNLIEKENKLTFIVTEKADKRQITEALKVLYGAEVSRVNTARTIHGKKAFVKFTGSEGARDLATKLGLV